MWCAIQPLFYRSAELAQTTEFYPLEELNDYLRLHPEKRDAAYSTLNHFDLRWFVPK